MSLIAAGPMQIADDAPAAMHTRQATAAAYVSEWATPMAKAMAMVVPAIRTGRLPSLRDNGIHTKGATAGINEAADVTYVPWIDVTWNCRASVMAPGA